MSTPIVSMPNMDESKRGSDPLVSIVIPCYMQAHFLSEAIETSLSQTYPYIEVIVVDDGSPDEPEQIASRYDEVKFVRQENQGVSAARNRGGLESKGEFLVFLDADDRLLPNAVQVGVECFAINANYGFVFGRGRSIDASGQSLPERYQPPIDKVGYLQLLERNPISFPALAMHKRVAFESVGGFRSFVNGHFIGSTADHDLCLRIASSYPIYFHSNTIAEYREHDTNMTRNSLRMLKSAVHVLNAQRPLVRGNRVLEKALNAGIRRASSYFGEHLIQELRSEVGQHHFTIATVDSLAALLWYYPEGLRDNAFRKMRTILNQRSRSGL